MININFTEEEAKFLSEYFENMKDKNGVHNTTNRRGRRHRRP